MTEKIKIRGGAPLHGNVKVGGAKNAALPALFACLLSEAPCILQNIPHLRDIQSAVRVLQGMGVACESDSNGGNQIKIQAKNLTTQEAPYSLVKTMRASILALGPLLARFGRAQVSLPGGCAIGARPVDLHIQGLRTMGADIAVEDGNIIARARRLHGAHITLPIPTVTGSENLMMAATLAQGETIIENAAREPEIADLAKMLCSMGAEIAIDNGVIRVQGKTELHGTTHAAPPDRIEAGTYLCAVAACGGDVRVCGVNADDMRDLIEKLVAAGAQVDVEENTVRLRMAQRPKAVSAATAPYPGFPTDMQAQWLAVNCVAEGEAVIVETIFENRFMHVSELLRLGAQIQLRHNAAHVIGVAALSGAPLMATDLRASASLVIAALAAQGESVIDRIYHLDRGYEKLAEKLQTLGADVTRIQ